MAAPFLARRIRDFVSSTFTDRKADRDDLVKFTFPELRRLCAARDRLLLAVSPGVITSKYTMQEWRFAQDRGEKVYVSEESIQETVPALTAVNYFRYVHPGICFYPPVAAC